MADHWSESEIHLWRADLRVPPENGLLSDDELDRAWRLIFERDRNRFVAARSMLRRICAGYTGQNPKAVRFRYSTHGKPEFAAGEPGAEIHFNLSHSEDLAVYAFSSRLRVGVDIERVRPLAEMDTIVGNFFSPVDQQSFGALDPAIRNESFFRYWTRREAFVKAMALGIAASPEDLHVSGTNRYRDWSVRDIAVGAGFAGAIAAEALEFTVIWRDVSAL
jgi:4'-phosphopantetheinyl transferase